MARSIENTEVKKESTMSNHHQPLKSLLTPDQMIELLGVSSRTLWRLRSKGAIPQPVKYGGNVRWRGVDVQRWLDEGCPGSE